MNHEDLKKIEYLLGLSDRKFKQHLFYQSNQTKRASGLVKFQNKHHKVLLKRNQNITNILIKEYYQKTIPYWHKLEVIACEIYCVTQIITIDEINDLSNVIVEILGGIADPTLITFIIKYILKKICKCSQMPRLSYSVPLNRHNC